MRASRIESIGGGSRGVGGGVGGGFTRARVNSASVAKVVGTAGTVAKKTKNAAKKSTKITKQEQARINKLNILKEKGLSNSRVAERIRNESPNGRIKIKSGGDIKPANAMRKMPPSYNQNKDMPNLIKIDSAKGNTVKKIAYRKRSSN